MGGGLLNKGAKGLAIGIGLAQEGYHSHKEKKAQTLQQHPQSDGSGLLKAASSYPDVRGSRSPSPIASRVINISSNTSFSPPPGPPPSYSEKKDQQLFTQVDIDTNRVSTHETNVDQLARMALNDEVQGGARGSLPCPVIIPQRRPGSRSRGFVRAYAPDLENCGITQPMFLDFLDQFDTCCQANPWILSV